MDEKVIAKLAGERIELSKESFCYFRIGDIVTRDNVFLKNRTWCGETVKIVGFTREPPPDRLWGVMKIGTVYEKIALWSNDLDALLLLEREGWEYKVGDEIVDEILEKGTIVMIDPVCHLYLVEFKNVSRRIKGISVEMGCSPFIPIIYRNKILENHLLYNERNISVSGMTIYQIKKDL